MALVESIDIPLGTKIPYFTLSDPDGRVFTSDSVFGPKGLLLVVTCNHCPYAIAVWPRVIRLACHAGELGIQTIAVNPNIHPNYPEDAPEKMRSKIQDWGITFPYLVDATQQVARELKAQCTPDIYLYDAAQKLVYHGRIDDNWQDEHKATRFELRAASENLGSGKPIAKEQFPTIGCSIKWK